MDTAPASKGCRDLSPRCETCRKSMKRISRSRLCWRARNTQNRLADRAPRSGAANCVACNLGQVSAWRRFVRAALRAKDRDHGKVAIAHRAGNARESDPRVSDEL